MSNFTVGKYLATRLEQIGLKHYFMVPGDYNLVLLDELLENDNLEQIGCCNELNAAYAAEGYARVNGAGAVLTTFNVGALLRAERGGRRLRRTPSGDRGFLGAQYE